MSKFSKFVSQNKILTLIIVLVPVIVGVYILYLEKPIITNIPEKPLFVGDYYCLKLDFSVWSRITSLNDVEIKIKEGEHYAKISYSPDHSDNLRDVMLMAGIVPGDYTLQIFRKSNQKLITEMKFEISDRWRDENNGPGIWCHAMMKPGRSHEIASADFNIFDKNIDTISGAQNIAVFYIHTDEPDQTESGNIDRAKWQDMMNRVKQYYSEVSYNKVQLNYLFDNREIHLNGNRNEFYYDNGSIKPTFVDYCINAIHRNSSLNLKDFQYLVLIVNTRKIGQIFYPGKPLATLGEFTPFKTKNGDQQFRIIVLPDDLENILGYSPIHGLICKLFGHNFGVRDLQNKWKKELTLDGWDIMANERTIPSMTIPHRKLLGWLNETQVQQVRMYPDSASIPDYISDQFMISASEIINDKTKAIEFKLSEGESYFFEFRKGQTGQVGDQFIPGQGVLVGTHIHYIFDNYQRENPLISLINEQSIIREGDQFNLELEGGYEEFLGVSWRKSMDVSGESAKVDFEFKTKRRPDPAIIEVAYNHYTGKPVIQLANRGNLNAPGVKILFSGSPFGLRSEENMYGEELYADLSQGESKYVVTNHQYQCGCVTVQIPFYHTPQPSNIPEISQNNNNFRGNICSKSSTISSPGSRETIPISMNNIFDEKLLFFINLSQTNPWYRTYLERKWIYLDPGAEATLKLMSEFADELPSSDMYDIPGIKEMREKPNHIYIQAFMYDTTLNNYTFEPGPDAETVVNMGFETRILYELKNDLLVGSVQKVKDGTLVLSGNLIVYAYHSLESDESADVLELPVSNGQFNFRLNPSHKKVYLYFEAPDGYLDSEVEILIER